jgi:hypothetical protein
VKTEVRCELGWAVRMTGDKMLNLPEDKTPPFVDGRCGPSPTANSISLASPLQALKRNGPMVNVALKLFTLDHYGPRAIDGHAADPVNVERSPAEWLRKLAL